MHVMCAYSVSIVLCCIWNIANVCTSIGTDTHKKSELLTLVYVLLIIFSHHSNVRVHAYVRMDRVCAIRATFISDIACNCGSNTYANSAKTNAARALLELLCKCNRARQTISACTCAPAPRIAKSSTINVLWQSPHRITLQRIFRISRGILVLTMLM